ncbi:uncharacterized protein LOC100880027 [Megachile rotundata]|uniref:uncharacterized protein LOC100880027 n=1 Tax=Megachile rotundata TaxID=143995 RepID=UPI000614EF2E|nr:PREDICTED: uncharacterized protein LOC100880027 isoform X2 [Megachile rotundata]
MLPLKPALLIIVLGLIKLPTVAPDSAGIVEMVNGLAYGGIPYGSVTGMVAKYPGFMRQQIQAQQLNAFRGVQPLAGNPNFGSARLVGVQPQTVRIYNVPSVVGSLGQIRY